MAPKAQRGMTLIELMTVVVIVSILAGVAVSTYRSQLLRANRSEAKTALLRLQVAQEKFFLQNNRYALAGEMATAPPAGLGVSASTPGGGYSIAVATDAGVAAPIAYTATATATNGQLDDHSCRTLSITETGQRSAADDSNSDATATCWR